ncbi:MAG: beta-galactosidase trimerization domain-containing protein [Armatimonadota bacterium]|nr:MAG: beta-galactosidase trimerization domain-containing protein [Armatimonadota bacterium]
MRESSLCLLIATFGLAAALAGAAAAPAVNEELEEDHELSMEFETPHTDWARPYALGKVRVLYIGWGSYDRGIEARDIVELMQRFDIEAKTAYYHRIIDSPQTEWRGGEAGVQRIMRLLDEPWDCFLFAGVPVTHLPHEAQYKLYQAVTGGAGIVFLGVDDERALKPKNRITDLPPFLANDPPGDAFRIKAGRGMRLPARPHVEYHAGWETDYDYWLERVGRAVLWAAGKGPRIKLGVAVPDGGITRTDLPRTEITVEWGNASGAQIADVQARLRRTDGTSFALSPQGRHSSSDGPLVFPLARRYPAGHYHLDVIARGKDGIEAWATVPMEITSPRVVAEVELNRVWGEIGESIAGTVRLGGDALAGETVRAQLLDARGRILAQTDEQVTNSAASFEFAVEDWMPMLLEVRALVMDGNEEVSSAYSYFRVTKRQRGQFNVVVWDYPPDPLSWYVEQQLARLGCTVQLQVGAPPLVVAASDIAQIPYTTRIMTSWDKNGYMRPACWNDEPAVDEWINGIASTHERSRQHGVFVYSLGDETATTGSCVHPACLAAYRRYLQQEYGDISALNQSWESRYASFDEVQLSAPGDNDEAGALQARQYARWYDRQAFKGYNFVGLCERFDRRFKEMDPQALTGFEGAGRFSDGADIDLICRTNGFWSPYPGVQDEVLRSIAPRDFIRSNWMGYTKDADSLLEKYWRMITRGCDSVWWWRWDGFGTYRGLLAPHLAPWKAIKEMQRDTQIVRDGLGDLLLTCRREDDGIAILYSYPSLFANRIEAGPSYGAYEGAHAAWHRALRALGLQFNYVTDRMLRRGEFNARRYKTLILPQAEAIGPREAEVIREFVENGGTVIADVRAGIYDHHCKPLQRGLLDGLLGIERTGNAEAVTAKVDVDGGIGERALPVRLAFADAKVDPAVRAEDGEAAGAADGAPICIVKPVGRGRAVLLNFALESFPRLADAASAEADCAFLAKVLALGGIEASVRVTDRNGKPVRDTEVIRWNGRGVDFLTVFGGKDELVCVTLPHALHVYDLRERRYLGLQTTFTVHKLPTRATFVALSPRRLPTSDVALSQTQVRRGEQLTVRLSYAGSRAHHAARVQVYQPDGTHAEWFNRVLVAGPEGADVVLPIAYNDPSGAWTVRAVDLYTDETTEARFIVQ